MIFENIKADFEERLKKPSLAPDELIKTLDIKCKKCQLEREITEQVKIKKAKLKVRLKLAPIKVK